MRVSRLLNLIVLLPIALLLVLLLNSTAFAQQVPGTPQSYAYVFSTLLLLIGSFLVFFMAAGFCMLEVGMVRSKNANMQCAKNISLYSVAAVMFWLTGYNLIYGNSANPYIGTLGIWSVPVDADPAASHAAAADWMFQMVFCGAAASIVSGALAERVRIIPFLVFVAVLTGFIYPIAASWLWGGGWLAALGFKDFAGSTIVHCVGGWAALAGAIVLGPRAGRYGADGSVNLMPGSSMPMAALGTFILWLGWFGFNGGSQLALGSISDASAVSRIFANTNTAACAGLLVSLAIYQLIYKKADITMALNGALAGLVSITAEPLTPSFPMAALIGGVGGALVVFLVPLLTRLRVDDVVGAIPVHLGAGLWGTFAVPFTNPEAQFGHQIIGILVVAVFSFALSFIVFTLLRIAAELRATAEEQALGLDKGEVGRWIVEAIESIPEGFAFFDETGRLELFNQRFKVLAFDRSGVIVRPGASFNDIVQKSAAAGLGPKESERYVSSRLESFDGSHSPILQQFNDGSWIQTSEHRTSSGGVVSVYSDLSTLKQRETEAANANRMIYESLQYASRIQSALLPSQSYLEQLTREHLLIWRPRDIVGGDFFWVHRGEDGYFIILGDCTGHGMPGALLTMIICSTIDRLLESNKRTDPGQLINALHRNIQALLNQRSSDAETDDGCELGVCWVGPEQQRLVYAGAHFPLFHASRDGVSEVKGAPAAVGYARYPADTEFPNRFIDYKSGDRFFLASDGIMEQVGGKKGLMFGKRRFRTTLESVQSHPLRDQGDILWQALIDYRGSNPQRDDVTVLGFEP